MVRLIKTHTEHFLAQFFCYGFYFRNIYMFSKQPDSALSLFNLGENCYKHLQLFFIIISQLQHIPTIF